MDKPSCPKCGNIETEFTEHTFFVSGNFSDCVEFLEDGSIIIYYWCAKCDTEFQVVYRPDEKSIVSEKG